MGILLKFFDGLYPTVLLGESLSFKKLYFFSNSIKFCLILSNSESFIIGFSCHNKLH